ncbi:GGDEF domain-containing protein [Zavarzinia aquatilis]|uniref:diguanylate cyclase n=1 Tax=Zavarzinia aquatilis TaxID=2211142 RepID=A0A317EFP8_9PROT|nr:GGDEF domain-containing protein [Zavarzinia aquatilis]PWR25669.1 hypothetical protein DKG74_01520 [Zavarzinia aquatilis]
MDRVKALKPLHVAILAASFGAVLTTIGTAVFIAESGRRIDDDLAQAAQQIRQAIEGGDMPPHSTGKMVATTVATFPLVSGSVDACVGQLRDASRPVVPLMPEGELQRIATQSCEGREIGIAGDGSALEGFVLISTRKTDEGGRMATLVGFRPGREITAGSLIHTPPVIGLAIAIILSSGLFGYALGRRAYRSFLTAKARAVTDGLSGVLRREQFLTSLGQFVAAGGVRGESGSVLALDLDHFKRVNDSYGHAAGDEVIRTCGELIKTTVRSGDLVGRTGGEEFMILLPGMPKFRAAEVADRLRKRLAAHAFTFDGQTVFVTISIGVASFMPGDTLSTLAARADHRLYAAKNAGRNAVVWEDDDNHDY